MSAKLPPPDDPLWHLRAKQWLLTVLPDTCPWPGPDEFGQGLLVKRLGPYNCCCTLGWAQWMINGDPRVRAGPRAPDDLRAILGVGDAAGVLTHFVLRLHPNRTTLERGFKTTSWFLNDQIYREHGPERLAALWAAAMAELGYEQEDQPWYSPNRRTGAEIPF